MYFEREVKLFSFRIWFEIGIELEMEFEFILTFRVDNAEYKLTERNGFSWIARKDNIFFLSIDPNERHLDRTFPILTLHVGKWDLINI